MMMMLPPHVFATLNVWGDGGRHDVEDLSFSTQGMML